MTETNVSVTILAISGSLRQLSSNTTVLRAAALLTPDNIEINLYTDLGSLPPFNPDLEGDEPQSVLNFRDALKSAGGVMICSPEYAHGVSGVLKNALDWVVGSGELAFGKPVSVINASATSKYADPQLREILKTMDANVVPGASLAVPVLGRKLDEFGIAADPALSQTLKAAIASLVTAIQDHKPVDLTS